MTTSNNHQHPESPTPPSNERQFVGAGDHWFELSATLSSESTAKLADWIDEDLATFEAQWSHLVTPGSLKRSLRR